jgi:hypothetical protein
MTEIEELRKAWNETKQRLEENDEFVRKALLRAEGHRRRILEAAGIRPVDGRHVK